MKGYTAEDLKKHFERCGRIRKGKNEFANDATYWEGGRCNWGGSHNLLEDSRTIAREFAKIESLKEITDVLRNCHDNKEFESKKANFIQKCDESISGARPRTGYSNSMFGICIIWAHEAMSPEVERQLEGCRKEVQKVKNALEKETYKWVEELNRIQLEIDQIKKKMEENKRKAMNEKDPKKRTALLLEIEEDGKLLQQKYREHQEHSNKFKFDPEKHVSGLVDAMKRAIEKSNKDGYDGGGNPNRPNKSGSNPDDPFGDNNGGGRGDNNQDPKPPRGKKEEKKEKDNSQMLLIIVAVIVIFFLMSQKDNHSSHRRDYEEFDYY